MAKDDADGCLAGLGCVGVIVATPVLSVLSAFYHAWAATVLWQWFIEPHEHVHAPAYAVMVGASYIATLYGTTHTSDIKAEYKDGTPLSRFWGAVIGGLTKPVIILAFGWLIHQFVK